MVVLGIPAAMVEDNVCMFNHTFSHFIYRHTKLN